MKAALLSDQHINGRLIPAGTIVDVVSDASGEFEVLAFVTLSFCVDSKQLREVPSND